MRICVQAEYGIFGHALISIKSYPRVLRTHGKAKGSRMISAGVWHQQRGDSRTPRTSGPISHTTELSFSHWEPQPSTSTLRWIDGSNHLTMPLVGLNTPASHVRSRHGCPDTTPEQNRACLTCRNFKALSVVLFKTKQNKKTEGNNHLTV